MGKPTKKTVTLTLSEEAIEIAKKKAEEENRSLSNYTETLLLKQEKEE